VHYYLVCFNFMWIHVHFLITCLNILWALIIISLKN
jgi:hypothetical protein